jgi:hypothetical protein
MRDIGKEPYIDLAGGRIRCRRCQAMSTRSGEQCKKAALKSKRVCAFHGGKSTGPKTEAGKQRIAQAHWIHGRETRAGRLEYSDSATYLRELEDVAWALGMMTGTRTRGPKPKNYQPVKTLEAAKRWIAMDALGLRCKKNKVG